MLFYYVCIRALYHVCISFFYHICTMFFYHVCTMLFYHVCILVFYHIMHHVFVSCLHIMLLCWWLISRIKNGIFMINKMTGEMIRDIFIKIICTSFQNYHLFIFRQYILSLKSHQNIVRINDCRNVSCTNAVAKYPSLFRRVLEICSTELAFTLELKFLKQFFRRNNFPH